MCQISRGETEGKNKIASHIYKFKIKGFEEQEEQILNNKKLQKKKTVSNKFNSIDSHYLNQGPAP